MKIKAQMLYDLRTMTGFISGDDLHNLFRDVLGEPSPSGYMEFEVSALSNARYGEKALAELKRESGMKKYVEAAEPFGNMVYEQADSLKPAAEKWKLELRQTPWLAKSGKLPPPFDNPKLAAALFSDDGLKNKRNTEAVEVASGTLVSARVLEHKPAALQPLEAVKGDIEKRVRVVVLSFQFCELLLREWREVRTKSRGKNFFHVCVHDAVHAHERIIRECRTKK